MIALLGLAQIPLGLTLYGSPIALFVLYALAVFALLIIYFILSHLRERSGGSDYDSRYSYGTGSVVDDRRHRRNSGGRSKSWVKTILVGIGAYWLFNRIRGRRESHGRDKPEVVGSHRRSSSYVEDEKYSQYGRDPEREGDWEERLLRIAAPIGLGGLVTRYYDRRYRDRDSDVSDYGPPPGGPTPINDARYNNGRYDGPAGPPPGAPVPFNQPPPVGQYPPNQPLPASQHPLNQPLPPAQGPPLRRQGSVSSFTHSSFESASGQQREGHGLRDGLATLGAAGLVKSIWNRRKARKEDERLEEEQDARTHGNRLTGDGRPPRRHRRGESTLTSDTSSIGGHPGASNAIPPVPAGVYPTAGAGGAATTSHGRDRTTAEELPLGGIPRHGQVPMPEIPPDRHGGLFHDESSGSDVYIGADGRNHWRHREGRNAAAASATGGTTGLGAAELGNSRRGSRDRRGSQADPAAAEASSRRRDRSNRRQSASGGEESMAASTPVSVKVKMHNDGRHVTLRRLPEAEAAAERQARRTPKDTSSKRRSDSASSLSGTDGTTERFRRNQLADRQRAEAMRIESERLAEARNQAQAQSNPNAYPNVPAPPPIPESSSGLRPPGAMSVGSPGTYDGNTTEASADYANNRRRRRAERVQAKQARDARRVEFE